MSCSGLFAVLSALVLAPHGAAGEGIVHGISTTAAGREDAPLQQKPHIMAESALFLGDTALRALKVQLLTCCELATPRVPAPNQCTQRL